MTNAEIAQSRVLWQRRSYDAGAATAERTYEEIIYGDLAPAWIFDCFDANAFFEAGRQGYDFPEYRTGWRYGDIPETGRSHNFREGAGEAGVSVMQLDGEKKIKTLAEARGSFNRRPKIRVGGWVNPCDVGGDGEPLLLAARVLSHRK